MKVVKYDEYDEENIGIGQTNNSTYSPRKEVSIKLREHTKISLKREASFIRESKLLAKGKKPRITEKEKDRKIKKELKREKNRKEKGLSNGLLIDYTLPEEQPRKIKEPTKEMFLGEYNTNKITQEIEKTFGIKEKTF